MFLLHPHIFSLSCGEMLPTSHLLTWLSLLFISLPPSHRLLRTAYRISLHHHRLSTCLYPCVPHGHATSVCTFSLHPNFSSYHLQRSLRVTPYGVKWDGVTFFIDFLDTSWHFPNFFNLKSPLATPGVGKSFLCSNQSCIYPNMCAKFGCGPMVVSKQGGGTDTHTHTHTHTHRDAAALYNR